MAVAIAETFNSFLSIDDSIDYFKPHSHILEELGEILAKYGLHHKYRVQLIHNHFKINEDEVMVEVTNGEVGNGEKRLSMPWKKTNNSYIIPKQILHKFGMDLSLDGHAIPHAWVVKDGSILPYEYKWIDNTISSSDTEHFSIEFIQEFYNKLKNHRLTTTIGITSSDMGAMIETTYDNVRVNLYSPLPIKDQKPESEEGEYTPTQWSFKETPKRLVKEVRLYCFGKKDTAYAIHQYTNI